MALTATTCDLLDGNVDLLRPNLSLSTSSTSNWVLDKSSFNPKKVSRYSSLKRGKDEVPLGERVKLERILGLTVSSNAALDCDPNTGLIVYTAGCVVVVYNPRKNKQTHILNASRKTITTLAISLDGRHVVTGECGHQPHVRVWDIQEKVQVAEFSGHKFGINCVAFSPNLKYVVSVGSQHDMIVNVWDWRNNVKVASNKVSSKVKAVAFSEDGDHFVTVGNRHVKFWYLDYFRSTKYKEPVPLMGRSAILGEQRNNYFCDVACGCGDAADSTFAITKSGLLCEFNSRRLLDKWVELRASANCLNVGLEYIFIGCADGIVRCFSPYTLEFITTLPRTHHLGVDIAKCVTLGDMASHPKSAKYPDTIAIALDEINRKVTCIYNDHSLYVWDIKDIRTVGKSHSFLYHSACIWGAEIYPEDSRGLLPAGSFVTCSSDDTIRIWKLDHSVNNSPNNKLYPKNVYCPDLLKILYIDDELNYLCASDRSLSASSTEKAETTYDGRNGVRCIKISPDGTHLASGDRSGNIRIHGIQFMDELMKIEAHDSEVLCLEYSRLPSDHRYLASASRDRLIHVFDVNHDYSFLQTLDDHSSSITAVRFVQQQDNFQMISCGVDKSVIFRGAQFTPQLQFVRNHHVVGKTTLYDMDVDSSQKHILTACQDRNIRVYNIHNGKHSRTFKGSQGEDGTLIKVVLDNSGLYVATSSTDKNLCIYDFYSGDCVATMYGHSEIVTGFRFTNDGKQLISVSGDGCIFVWRLPPEMTRTIQLHMAQLKSLAKAKQGAIRTLNARRGVFEVPQPLKPAREFNFDVYNANEEDDPSYRFSVGPLPLWAKKQISDDGALKDAGKAPNVAQPKGRWAQRVEKQGINVKSFYETGHVIPCPVQSFNDSQSFDASPEPEFSYKGGRREAVAKFQNVDQSFEEYPASFSQIRMGNAPSETPVGMVTVKRGGSEFSPSRARSLTESSSMSIDDYDIEGDGDIADDETESNEPDLQEIIYYPPLDESSDFADFSEFIVCNTNLDDLREAHRRNKKSKVERPGDIPLLQIQGVRSTDSEEDEEVTTPQNADQTIFNTFSMSTESLDMVGQRERFMKNNFENLDVGKTEDESENNDNRLSITSRFLSKTPERRNSTDRKSDKDVPPSPKRLESMKRIEETRRKLDTIGWKASLNSSKSSTDLTYIPEKDFAGRPIAVNKGNNGNIWRTSSMIDLSAKAPRRVLPSRPNTVTSKNAPRRNSAYSTPIIDSANILRSSSMTTLAGVGDEDSRLMRATISSKNKMRANQPNDAVHRPLPKSASSSSLAASRRELTLAGSGTSSGDTSPVDGSNEHPVRTRSTSMDRSSLRPPRPEPKLSLPSRPIGTNRSSLSSAKWTSERNLSRMNGDQRASSAVSANITVTKTSKHEVHLKQGMTTTTATTRKALVVAARSTSISQGNGLDKSPEELPVKDNISHLDVVNAPLSRELCDTTAEDLKQASDNVLQLFKRVSMDCDLPDDERIVMLNSLSLSVAQAQETLRPVRSVPSGGHPDLVQVTGGQKVPDGSGVNEMSRLLEQYSHRLIDLVQQGMSTQPGST